MGALRIAMVGGRGHHSVSGAFGKSAQLVGIAADGLDDSAKGILGKPYAAGVKLFDSYETMLDETRPDAVSIGPWPAKNAGFALKAMERNIHVISDKPIANSDEELAALRKMVAAKPGIHLLTEFVMRHGPAFMAARQAVRDGKIGEVVLVSGQKSYRFGESRPDFYKSRVGYPGTVAFIGSHLMDLAYWITGLQFACACGGLQGNIAKKEYGTFEDHAILIMKLKNGADVAFTMDYLRPAAALTHGDDRIRVAGSLGVVDVRDDKCVLITKDQHPTDLAMGGHSPTAADELVNTIQGKGTGVFSTADSLYMAEVILRARESVDGGKTVQIR